MQHSSKRLKLTGRQFKETKSHCKETLTYWEPVQKGENIPGVSIKKLKYTVNHYNVAKTYWEPV